jgi:hypothetical protein
MKRQAKGFSQVNMRKRRRIGNDKVGGKGLASESALALFIAGAVATLHDARQHLLLPADVAVLERLHAWDQARVLGGAVNAWL